jgi:hypothetical protein
VALRSLFLYFVKYIHCLGSRSSNFMQKWINGHFLKKVITNNPFGWIGGCIDVL